ncbi:MAG: anhydro-N-acetylmuramic acid kinase [Proteobacteria bacterium]|nr:anhydro-N-acetylmuramic acid kinase [Pseudomonadota bacterium]
MTKLYKSIGLMSGTSMDGLDLALIESDGKKIINRKNFDYCSYTSDFKNRLRALIYNNPKLAEIKLVENELTLLHADLVNNFLSKNNIKAAEIDLVAFHGHTVLHIPERQVTWQIGNSQLLAKETGINVVSDFRTRDVVFGGQGAPLVPIYHFYLFHNRPKPTAVLNIGGISNITYLHSDLENQIEAFDTCFGNAPLDDLIKNKFGLDFDEDGKISKKGQVDFTLADQILQNEIFHKKPPKSFDRGDFSLLLAPINSLKNPQDALATLAYIHAKAIEINLGFLTARPKEILVCGGGRKNIALMDEMKKCLSGVEVKSVDEIGFDGDAVEAEAFAFLGIRSLLHLPISFSNTTGVFRQSSSLNSQKKIVVSPENNYAPVSLPQHSSSCGGVFYRA